jgi:DNA-binding PadR family transcriptional regulator
MRQLLLALLRRGPAYGYELKRAYDELFTPVWPAINVGQIYVTLGRLGRDGLVAVHAELRADGPDRKVYELTEEGEKVLDAWLVEASERPTGRSDLVLKLVGAWVSDATRVHGLVAEHRQHCLEDLRALDALAADAASGSLPDLLVQGAALHLQAELRFLDLVDERLDPTRPPLQPNTDEGHER